MTVNKAGRRIATQKKARLVRVALEAHRDFLKAFYEVTLSLKDLHKWLEAERKLL